MLAESDAFVLQNMVFDRLAPLLVLRTLAVKSFANIAADQSKLIESLLER